MCCSRPSVIWAMAYERFFDSVSGKRSSVTELMPSLPNALTVGRPSAVRDSNGGSCRSVRTELIRNPASEARKCRVQVEEVRSDNEK